MVAVFSFSMQAEAAQMLGTSSCGSWVSEKDATVKSYQKGWILGFLSGLSSGADINPLKKTDAYSIFLWIDNYCKANPLKDLVDAANGLVFELEYKK